MRRRRGVSAVVILAAVVALVALVAGSCAGDYNRFPNAAPGSTTTTSRPRSPAPTTTAPPRTTAPTTTTAPPTSTPPSTAPQPTAPPTTRAQVPLSALPGQLAVVASDGALVAMRPDGSRVTTVTAAPTGGHVIHPTWSLDASRLAFSVGGSDAQAIGMAAPDGSLAARQPLTPAPFLYAWSPKNGTVAYLRTIGGGVEVGLVDSSGTGAPRSILTAAPIVASWSPDGRLGVAAGGESLLLVDAAGNSTPISVPGGPATAIAWKDAKTLLAAVHTSGGDRLALVDAQSGTVRELLAYNGVISFELDKTGTKVAFQVLPQQGGGGSTSVVAYQAQPPTTNAPAPQVPSATVGQLGVLDLGTDTVTTVAQAPAAAFQWSPNGDRLAYLTQTDPSSWVWKFWAPSDTIVGTAFAPTQATIDEQLPAFDLQAQTRTWWSPDGQAFVMAGRVNGTDGVWVQQLVANSAAVRVASGELAVWSPR